MPVPMGRPKGQITKLTDKMYRAVTEYFANGFVKKDALLAAGYARSVASNFAGQVFDHPTVIKEIDRRHKLHDATAVLTKEWIVTRLMALADSSVAVSKFIRVSKDGSLYWDFTDATEAELKHIRGLSLDFYTDGKGDYAREVKKFKIDTSDPLAVLNTLARIEGLFQDRLKLEGDDGVIEALQSARRRASSTPSD